MKDDRMQGNPYEKAERPTMYFIGVTTAKSAIMKIFPKWMQHLGVEAEIKGIDFVQHDKPESYRKAVDFIKNDPLSAGALVTTHKIDVLEACRDLFDRLDYYAELTGEISSISKNGGMLWGHAKDPITSGLALEAMLRENYWQDTGAEMLIIGAGGSSIALSVYLLETKRKKNRPAKLYITNRSEQRLTEIKRIHGRMATNVPVEYILTPKPEDNDAVMERLVPYSVVANATGLGKDAPGSPISDRAVFPEHGVAWDFNYRGNLLFLAQAARQKETRNLRVEDGWVYFIHGWTQVIAEVFHKAIPATGPEFEKLADIASAFRDRN